MPDDLTGVLQEHRRAVHHLFHGKILLKSPITGVALAPPAHALSARKLTPCFAACADPTSAFLHAEVIS